MNVFTLQVAGMQPFSGVLDVEQQAPLLQLYRQPHDIELVDNLDDRRFMGPGIWKSGNNRDNAEIAPIPKYSAPIPTRPRPSMIGPS